MKIQWLVKTALSSVFMTCGLACAPADKGDSATPNLTTAAALNLKTVAADFTPSSLTTTQTSSRWALRSDPCEGITNFAICQSRLIRAYLRLGRSMVTVLANFVENTGDSIGEIPDGNTGTSQNGVVSWNKVDATHWSLLVRGAGLVPQAYVAVAGTTYGMKIDNSLATLPTNLRIDTQVTFTSASDWSVDLFVDNADCDPADPGAPTRAHIKLTKANGLWTGKAMLYFARWEAPNETLSCSTPSPPSIAMYTDFVGNEISTRAALYLIPASNNDLSAISSFGLTNFCTHFASACATAGLSNSLLASYGNPWCTPGPTTAPTWNDSCSTNTAVNAASFSLPANWVTPATLSTKVVVIPASL